MIGFYRVPSCYLTGSRAWWYLHLTRAALVILLCPRGYLASLLWPAGGRELVVTIPWR